MAQPIVFTKQLAAANAALIAASQSPGAGAITLVSASVTVDTATAANTAVGRRVIITSGGNDLGINFTVNGTGPSGSTISDTFAGASGAAAQSNLDFVTVTSITHTGSVAGTLTAGTNGVGSSPWISLNRDVTSVMNVGLAVELVSGSAGYTVEYTYDDPNNLLGGALFPLAFSSLSPAALVGASATKDGAITSPIAAIRLSIASGTGALRARILQSGIG